MAIKIMTLTEFGRSGKTINKLLEKYGKIIVTQKDGSIYEVKRVKE